MAYKNDSPFARSLARDARARTLDNIDTHSANVAMRRARMRSGRKRARDDARTSSTQPRVYVCEYQHADCFGAQYQQYTRANKQIVIHVRERERQLNLHVKRAVQIFLARVSLVRSVRDVQYD